MENLLEAISADPEIIDTLERDDLEAAETQLREAGLAAVAAIQEGTSEDRAADLAAAAEAKERLEAVKARLAVFAQEDTDIAAEAAAIAEAFAGPEEEVEEEEVEEVTDEAIEAVIEEETAVVASKPSIGALSKRVPKVIIKEGLVASAGPSVSGTHKEFRDSRTLGVAALDLWKSFGSSRPRHEERYQVARFDTSENYKYTVTGDEIHDAAVIDEMLKEVRSVGALTASGGVGAPAQPVYDFFSVSESAGMIQLPTVNAARGALTYPVSASYRTIASTAAWSGAAGQEHTNAEDVSGTSKATYQVTCPTTTTCTVAAYPVILTFGNFAQRFYPEHIAHSLAESMTFHDHFVNGTFITAMVAASTAVNAGDTGGGGLVNVANIVNHEAMLYRDTYRMSPTATLDLVLPAWNIDILVADLVARDSTQSFENARGRVLALFASLNINVQQVQDWQSPADAGDDGWRTASDMLLFAPGTFVRLDGGSLDLGIVRDSTLNATNDFGTFVETFETICEIGNDSWLLNDVTLCPRGATANRVTLDCNPGFNS